MKSCYLNYLIMEPISNYIILCLVDNFGCTRSIDNEIAFHCFVENCIFDTANLGNLLEHLDQHKEKWFGFCYTCNVQVHDNQVPLLKELQHWDKSHRLDKNGISILFQSDNKRSKLQEAANNARVQRLASNDEFDDPFNIVSLKPWSTPTLKTEENSRKMMRKICLYALYKCMGINCTFSTSCDRSMLTHLEDHHTSATGDRSWLECAYCDLISHSHSSLVQHILETHGSCTYQCPYCFYRSCTACNVVFHLKTFHECRATSVLICCGKKLPPVDRTVVEENRSKNVFPLRCSEVCNKITYRMDDFIHHLKNTTAHDNHFKCQFCGSNILISEATQHLLAHKMGVYQCIYCLYGANDVKSIHNHLCHTHPNRLPLICVRLTRKNQILSDKELTTVGSTLISKLAPFVNSKWLKTCPFTDEELSNNSLVRTSVRADLCPTLGEDSRLVNCSNDSLFNSQDHFLSYDDLKKDYTSDDWNEYFVINRLRWNDDFKDHNSHDEGFETCDETCNSTTISQMDRTEPASLPEVVKTEVILDTKMIQMSTPPPVMYSALTASDDDGFQPKYSTNSCKRETEGEKRSATEPFVNPGEPKLSDIFRYRCAYCPKIFKSPQLVCEHWKQKHEKPNAAFLFQITRAFQCCYCRHCNTFDDMKRHCQQKHSNETFAMVDMINPEKCALCSEFCNASTEVITDHFKKHNLAGVTNNTIRLESYLTDEWLDKIVAEQIPQRTDPASQIMYGCPRCLSSTCIDPSEMVAHIRRHFLQYQCSSCKKLFDQLNMLDKHLAIAHAKQNATSIVSANENKSYYLEMKIIFPNGLVLTKRECFNTRFGAVDELVEMVKEMNERDVNGQQSMQTQLSQPPPKSKTKPKTKSKTTAKRRRSPEGSILLPITKSGRDDGVDCKMRRGRSKVVEKRKDSPPKTAAVARKSDRNYKRK